MSVKFAIAAGTILFATAAFAAKPAQHMAPKVSRAAATKTALAAVPGGSVKSMHMETERGRSVYSFDIALPKKPGVEEVQVSALDGKIVSRVHESPARERAEMAHKGHK